MSEFIDSQVLEDQHDEDVALRMGSRDEDCNLDEEEFEMLMQPEDWSDLSKWKVPTDCSVTVGFGDSVIRLWENGKNEIQSIINQIRILTCTSNNRCVQPSDIMGLMFGATSPMFITFNRELHWNHIQFLQFISTCVSMEIHGYSVTQAYGSVHKGLPGCLSKKEFLAMWKFITIANTPTNLANAASTNKPLWESV